jgi:hypothetical protein
MWRAKRAVRRNHHATGEQAGDRVDRDDFERFAFEEPRENARHAPGEQRLATAGRSSQHQTVIASRRNLERAPGELLANNIGKIRSGVVDPFSRSRTWGTLEMIRLQLMDSVAKCSWRAHGQR